MLENVRHFITLKSVDKLIKDKNYEQALEKLNFLASECFRPEETFLKRGKLCQKLLMTEEAYNDFTYIINGCANKIDAYYARMLLNFEISNYYEAVIDASKLEESNISSLEITEIKFLSMVYSEQTESAEQYIYEYFGENKYKTIQFILNETAKNIANDELAKGLKLLEIIDLIDKDNPIKLLKEANIYSIAGEIEKEQQIMQYLTSVFPKYFVSHFRFSDIYEDKDLLEICFLLELKIFDKQNTFAYPMSILEGYRYNLEGRIIDSKEAFERAININPNKPEAYVLLAETLQLMSGYDKPEYKEEARKNYEIAMKLYERDNLIQKAENMRKQIKHLNSGIRL